eukprot:jgi/Tetstr1/443635/TSEL_031633.t1
MAARFLGSRSALLGLLLAALLAGAAAQDAATEASGADDGEGAADGEWQEEKDELLQALLAGNQSDYNYGRLIVVPKPGDSGSWDWADVEGLRYLWRADSALPELAAGNRLAHLLTNTTVMAILEFEKGNDVSREELLAIYRSLKRAKVFAQVFFDQKVQIQQTASAQETLSKISALGPALDQPSSGLPSAPIVDLGWVADLLKLDSGEMAEMAEQVRNHTSTRTNDPDWRQLWNIRQVRGDYTLGTNITMGQGAVVAVLDTGCVIGHADLQPNLWVNEAELNGIPGVDDDGNGYVDDVHGYNFVSDNGNVQDDNGHGSHVAGTIGAVANNGIGIAGLSPSVKIMCLKFMDETGAGFQSAAILGMAYAIQMNATVQNHSWGSPSGSQTLQNIIRMSGRYGQLMAAAAGNDGADTDNPDTRAFPAAYSSPELFSESSDYIISVGASDRRDRRAGFSNFGVQTVDLSAPGTEILSLGKLPGTYAEKQGTSQATPLVSAVAAIVMSIISLRLSVLGQPDLLSGADLVLTTKRVLLDTVDYIPDLEGTSRTGGRLNAFSAVQLALLGNESLIHHVEATRLTTLPWWALLLIVLAIAALVIAAAVGIYCCLAPKPPASSEEKRPMAAGARNSDPPPASGQV